jgi:hypothetical protein
MLKPLISPWLYRVAALAAFLLAQFLVLSIPMKMQEPFDWSFQYAARNFAQGEIAVEDSRFVSDSQEIWRMGGQLSGYSQLPDSRWGLTSAPGYAFYLVPFQALGTPGFGNTLLSLGLASILYLLLSRLRDEKTALFGVTILLFSPLYLAMWQRYYVDSLAAAAFTGMGGGLYLYYWINGGLKPRLRLGVLFLAGFLLAASVAVRYTNITVVAIFILHFPVMTLLAARKGHPVLRSVPFFLLGLALPALALMFYHGSFFGSVFSYGGRYSHLDISFTWDYLGTPMAYSIIRANVIQLWAPLLLALPVFFIGLPALLAAGAGKLAAAGRPGSWPELPAHAWWLFSGWVLSVFGFYLCYEWTTGLVTALVPFSLATRFYLPALLPLAAVSALALRRLPARLWGSILTVLVVTGAVFYLQVARLDVQFPADITPPSLERLVGEEARL